LAAERDCRCQTGDAAADDEDAEAAHGPAAGVAVGIWRLPVDISSSVERRARGAAPVPHEDERTVSIPEADSIYAARSISWMSEAARPRPPHARRPRAAHAARPARSPPPSPRGSASPRASAETRTG